jgi:hypothetical protein
MTRLQLGPRQKFFWLNRTGVEMSEEYQALRAEILKWQDRRFDLVKISISVVTSLLGLKLIVDKLETPDPNGDLWPLISSILLLYLAAANLIAWYASVSNSILAAYIKVFHEEGESTTLRWETRLQKLRGKGYSRHNMNHWIAVLQSVLAIICIVFPYAAASFASPSLWLLGLIVISSAAFLTSLILVVLFSYPREKYEKSWRELRDGEAQS